MSRKRKRQNPDPGTLGMLLGLAAAAGVAWWYIKKKKEETSGAPRTPYGTLLLTSGSGPYRDQRAFDEAQARDALNHQLFDAMRPGSGVLLPGTQRDRFGNVIG